MDDEIESTRDQILERYLGFGFGGLHFAVRDISAAIAEARRRLTEFVGRELQPPHRPNGSLHLWVVADGTGEIVGTATREVGLRGSALVIAHRQLQIGSQWRRRGFGSALLAANLDWYRQCGIEFVVMEAEGDGSVFAAVRGFDFDVVSYAGRRGFEDLPERELRLAAVDRLIHHPAVSESGGTPATAPRESVVAFLQRLRDLGADPARQVRGFERRLPQRVESGRGGLTGDELTFSAPREIAAYGQDEPLELLRGPSLGSAVLALTGWSGITSVATGDSGR